MLLIFLFAVVGFAQTPLDDAYQALRAKDYDRAIAGFRDAAAAAPARADIRKDLGYTLLKIGETVAAREQFAEALKLDPSDQHLALEYAFLCYETKESVEARRMFAKLGELGSQTAAEAFENVDRPLRDGIARWQQALTQEPGNFSAHEELAKLAEQRDELVLAAEHYDQAWHLRPERRDLLLDLGRVWRQQDRTEQAMAALLDRPTPSPEARYMAERSLEKGYMLDAARYLRSAYESDPSDYGVILKLAQTYNQLQNDREALRWFDLARRSPDPFTAKEATEAFRNLAPSLRRLRTTVWAFPMISTRWRDTFAYAQAKTELRLPGIRPYLSLRFIGDIRGPIRSLVGLGPQYLSERSVIVAAGLALPTWKGATVWFEAGRAVSYQGGATQSDLRGGLSFAKTVNRRRLFAETTDDVLYVSRFNRDTIVYSQNRVGWTLSDSLQVYWNANGTADVKREYWANTAETGPGVRWKYAALQFSVNFLRGVYLLNAGNPYRPNYNDIRIGVWYAFTH